MSIPRISRLADLDLVPGEPSSSPRYAIDEHGRRWVRKREEDSGPPELLAEAVAWLLGRELGAPIPDAAVCLDTGERSWLSRHVPHTKHWDPDLADLLTNYDGLGRILALDALLLNDDRHAGNLLIEPNPDLAHVRVWGIDFGVATVGYPTTFAARSDQLPGLGNHARGLPLEQAWEPAMEAAKFASELDPQRVRSIALEACDIAADKHGEVLSDTLVSRCRRAPELVEAHLAAVERLP